MVGQLHLCDAVLPKQNHEWFQSEPPKRPETETNIHSFQRVMDVPFKNLPTQQLNMLISLVISPSVGPIENTYFEWFTHISICNLTLKMQDHNCVELKSETCLLPFYVVSFHTPCLGRFFWVIFIVFCNVSW